MMHEIEFDGTTVTYKVDPKRLIPLTRVMEPVNVESAADLARRAVSEPCRFPPLALNATPDDHVAIVVDRWTGLGDMLLPVLEQLRAAQVRGENITIVGPAGEADPPPLFDLKIERHDPASEPQRCYVATTKAGRRVYLHRTAVEADLLVVVSEVRYSPESGTSGGPLALYPALADEATAAAAAKLEPRELRAEAIEVTWLLGQPFFVHWIAGAGGEPARAIAGAADSYDDARQALRELWRVRVDRPGRIVVATIDDDPATMSTADFASALVHAAAVCEPGGDIILVAPAAPRFGEGFAGFREFDDPGDAFQAVRKTKADDLTAAMRWLKVVQSHRVRVLCGWPEDVAEELFVTPLENAGQVQRLLDSGGEVIILPDAHRVRATVEQAP